MESFKKTTELNIIPAVTLFQIFANIFKYQIFMYQIIIIYIYYLNV